MYQFLKFITRDAWFNARGCQHITFVWMWFTGVIHVWLKYCRDGVKPYTNNHSCLWFKISPTREFFTRMEKSPLPVNGCWFWPMLGTHGHWAVRVFQCATPTVTNGSSVYNVHLRGPVTLTPVTWDSKTQPSACGTNALTDCATAAVNITFELRIDSYVNNSSVWG